jgi:cytochrome c oxidase cbb3-type subunit 3
MGLIIFELIILIAMSFHVRILTKSLSAKPQQADAPVVVKETVWDMLNASVAIEKEKDIMLDHDYDGIHELDNSLPPWWKYGFYLTIIVACIYLYRYHVSGTGLSSKEEYEQEMAQAAADKALYLSKSANNIDENSVTLMTAPGDIAAGKATFNANCVACHLADGGGGVGPNLTDDYWIHGGSVKDIFKTIKYGWQDKGMKSWKDDFSPLQIAQLASFVKSLHGTKPAAPKEKQGDLYVEGAAPGPAATDSTAKVDSAKADKKK